MIFNNTFLYGPLRNKKDPGEGGGGDSAKPPTPEEESAAAEGPKKEGKTAQQRAEEQYRKMSSAMGEYGQQIKEVLGPHQKLTEAYAAMQISQQKFIRSGGDFFQKMHSGGEYSTAMQNIIKQSQDFFGNAQRGTQAMLDLGASMRSFAGLSQGTQAELANVAMKMGEVGFKVADVAKALDNQAMAFGTNQKDLQNYALAMSRLSNTLFVEPTELMNNFNIAQENFAYSAEGTFEVFTKMQEQSAKTGVSFQKMAGVFGEGMDKFGDVTGVAGKLNAILGSSVFNPLELLNMDEAARVAKIREGIQGSPILNGRDINELSKFELKSIASTLNMSVLETRKFLTRDGDARQAMQKKLDDRIDAQGPDAMLNVDTTVQELNRLEDTIRNMRGALQNALIDISKQTTEPIINSFTSGIEKYLELRPGTLRGTAGIEAMRVGEQLAFGQVKKEDVRGLDAQALGFATQEVYNTAGIDGPINRGIAGNEPPTFDLGGATTAVGIMQALGIGDDSPIKKAITMAGFNAIRSMLDGGEKALEENREGLEQIGRDTVQSIRDGAEGTDGGGGSGGTPPAEVITL